MAGRERRSMMTGAQAAHCGSVSAISLGPVSYTHLVGVALVHDGLADGLAVGDLRLALVALNLELAAHTVDDDVELELAHAGDQGLAGLFVGRDLEGRILFGQLGPVSYTHLSEPRNASSPTRWR